MEKLEIVLKLISTEITENTLHQQIESETSKTVFGLKKSVSSNEFHKAGQSGLKPQFVVEVPTCDYNDEKTIEVDNKKYAVYRAYPNKNEQTELYCIERSGV